MIDAALQALEAFGRWTGIARSANIYALTSASHIIGLGLLFGSIAAIDLRLLGLGRALDADAVAWLRRFSIAGLALALVTGVLLSSTKPFEYAANPYMQLKLGVLGLAMLNALAFERWQQGRGIEAALESPGARLFGLASLSLWLTVIVLGRMIAFV